MKNCKPKLKLKQKLKPKLKPYIVSVMRLDGSTPTKYGLRLNMDEKYKGLKKQLSQLTGIPMPQILLVEILGALVRVSTCLRYCW